MTTARESVPTADEAFGLVVHEAMFRTRVSQVKMASTLSVHQSTLSKKLHGERPWSLEDMISVADALRVDLRDLLSEMWRDKPGGEQSNAAVNSQWALRGSNPQPTDYKVEGSVTDLSIWRTYKRSKAS